MDAFALIPMTWASVAGASMAALPALTAYKILFAILGCLMLATLIYTLAIDGSPFCLQLFNPYCGHNRRCLTVRRIRAAKPYGLQAFFLGFMKKEDSFVFLGWVAYRESEWIHTVFWVVLLVCFGSIGTCVYIIKKLFTISSVDAKDPISRVLLRNDDEHKLKFSSVMFGRILFSVLGVLVLATIICTIIIDGFPFRKELLTPWMAATLIDFYINVVAISVWIAHKESTWISTLIWISLLICFGSFSSSLIKTQMYHILLDSPSNHGSTYSK